MLGKPSDFLKLVGSSLLEGNAAELDEATLIKPFPNDINTDMTGDYKRLSSSKKFKKVAVLNGVKVMAMDWPVTHYSLLMLIDADGQAIGKFAVSPHKDYKNSINTTFAFIAKEHRRRGLGLALYSFLINSGLNVISDNEHTPGSKALWAKLAKEFVVQTIDEDGAVGPRITNTAKVYHARNRKWVLIASKNGYSQAGLTEAVSDAGREAEGGWIDPMGNFLPLDRHRGLNHEDIVAEFFPLEGDDSACSLALDAGWIRLFPWKSELTMDWQRDLGKAAQRRALAWCDKYGHGFSAFTIQSFATSRGFKTGQFADYEQARAFIVKMTNKSVDIN